MSQIGLQDVSQNLFVNNLFIGVHNLFIIIHRYPACFLLEYFELDFARVPLYPLDV